LDRFVKYFSKFLTLTEEETNAIVKNTCIQDFKRGTILLNQGGISKESYFILNGCIRQYCIIDGEEKTLNFFTEEQWVSSIFSYSQRKPADHYLACVEDCTLVVGNVEKENEFYQNFQEFPKLQSLTRIIMEKEISKFQEMSATYITADLSEIKLQNRINSLSRLL